MSPARFVDGERLARLETSVENMNTKINEHHEMYMTKFDEQNKMMKDFITTADSKYANKWVEEFMKKGIWIIVSAVLAALLGLVIFVPKASAIFS